MVILHEAPSNLPKMPKMNCRFSKIFSKNFNSHETDIFNAGAFLSPIFFVLKHNPNFFIFSSMQSAPDYQNIQIRIHLFAPGFDFQKKLKFLNFKIF